MQCPEKIEDVKKKIHFKAKKVLWHVIGNFVWASGNEQEKVRGSREKFSGEEGRAKGRVRLLGLSPIECTYLGLGLGEKEEQVARHASALALVMTYKAHREAEM